MSARRINSVEVVGRAEPRLREPYGIPDWVVSNVVRVGRQLQHPPRLGKLCADLGSARGYTWRLTSSTGRGARDNHKQHRHAPVAQIHATTLSIY